MPKIFCKGDLPQVEVLSDNLLRRVSIHLPNISKDDNPDAEGDTIMSVADNDDNTIPESVLLYQQQLRKVQAAQKAGTRATLDQLKVIYVDDDLVVVNKPSGMLCVPGLNDNPSLLSLVHEKFGNAADFGGNLNGMIVHRLDMDTSGLVVFGRTPAVVSALHKKFRDRKVEKEYEALVCGHVQFYDARATTKKQQGDETDSGDYLELMSGLIDLPLQRDHERPPFMRVATPTSERAASQAVSDLQRHGFKKLIRKRPKPSQTEFTLVAFEHLRAESTTTTTDASMKLTIPASLNPTTTTTEALLPVTRITLVPQTGRTHQLRVHCAAMGHPILGDPAYGLLGEANPNGGLPDEIMKMTFPFRATTTLQNALRQVHDPTGSPPSTMCLHAKLLGLHHPTTGEYMLWEAPVPF